MGRLESKLPETSHCNPLDRREFRKQAHEMVYFIADYYQNIESYPVLSQVQPGYLCSTLPKDAHYLPEPFETILKDVQNQIIPGIAHWLSPHFFAFFPSNISSASFLGEMLCTCFNSLGFNWLASPASTELEMTVIDWLANMLKLPKSFMFQGTGGGIIQNTTSEAILVTLIAARDKALDVLSLDNIQKLVVYASNQSRSTFVKACKVAGISPRNIRSIPTTLDTGFFLSPLDLRTVVEADLAASLVPLYLCVNVGTTSTRAIDRIGPLADVANEHGIWVHVDVYARSSGITLMG